MAYRKHKFRSKRAKTWAKSLKKTRFRRRFTRPKSKPVKSLKYMKAKCCMYIDVEKPGNSGEGMI